MCTLLPSSSAHAERSFFSCRAIKRHQNYLFIPLYFFSLPTLHSSSLLVVANFFQFRATHLYTGARDFAALQTAMFLIESRAGRDRSARVVVVCSRDAMFVCITIGSVAKMVHHRMFTSHPFFFFVLSCLPPTIASRTLAAAVSVYNTQWFLPVKPILFVHVEFRAHFLSVSHRSRFSFFLYIREP